MSTAAADQKTVGPSGLGGWLILPILGFIVTMLLTLWNLFQVVADTEAITAIFATNLGPAAALRFPIGVSFVGGCLVIASAIYCLILLFKKDHSIKKFATAHYLILMLAGFAEVWADSTIREIAPSVPADPSVIKDAVRGVFIACIWIPYFHMSKRVRNTFTAAPITPDRAAVENAGI
jgi:glucan phosphoethanolaminetransferase (alkaline phosphatase superfamily)